jgi:protein-disulfide isomerase/uncharacterized membrane protein
MQQTSRRFALLVFALLALGGIADGLYLTKLHLDFAITSSYASGACHQLSASGCDIAVKSEASELFGMPVALLGAAIDAGLLGTAVVGLFGVAVGPLLLLLAMGGVLVSLGMAAISLAAGSFCPFCVIWYGLNLAMLAAAWWVQGAPRSARGAFAGLGRSLRGAAFVSFAAVTGVALAVGSSVYGRIGAGMAHEQEQGVRKITSQILQSKPVDAFDVPNAPSKGAAKAEAFVHIVEFSDFQCPYCRGLWETLEAVGANRSNIRISFVNFPLDSKCNPLVSEEMHPYACAAARASECARRQDRFWQYADLLFHNQGALTDADLARHAEKAGLDVERFQACLGSSDVSDKILADIQLAAKLGVASTPTFFIDGYKAEGALPRPYVEHLIDAIGARKGAE